MKTNTELKESPLSTWVRGTGSLTVAALVSKPLLLSLLFSLEVLQHSLLAASRIPHHMLRTLLVHLLAWCWPGLRRANKMNFCPQRWQQCCILCCCELYPPVRSQWDQKSLLLPSAPPPLPLLPWLGFGAAQAVNDTGQLVQGILGYLQLLWNCFHTTHRAMQWWVSLLPLEQSNSASFKSRK